MTEAGTRVNPIARMLTALLLLTLLRALPARVVYALERREDGAFEKISNQYHCPCHQYSHNNPAQHQASM